MFQVHVVFLSLPDYVFLDSCMGAGSHVWFAAWLQKSISSSLCVPFLDSAHKVWAFTCVHVLFLVYGGDVLVLHMRCRADAPLPRTHISSLDHNAISARTTPPVCLNKPAVLSFFRSFRFSHTVYVEQNWALTNTHQLALPRFL